MPCTEHPWLRRRLGDTGRPAIGWCDGPLIELSWLPERDSRDEWLYLYRRFAPFRLLDGERGIVVGEVLADVAEPGCTEQRIGARMGHDVGIAVTAKASLADERDAAEHEGPVAVLARLAGEGVLVEPESHAHHPSIPIIRASRSSEHHGKHLHVGCRRDLAVARVSLDSDDPAAREIDERTAHRIEHDGIRGLEQVPVDPHGLDSNVRRKVRRAQKEEEPAGILEVRPIKVDLRRHRAYKGDTELQLTDMEFRILALLLKRPGEVITRDDFLKQIWGEDVYVSHRTVDTHVATLRKKIEEDVDNPVFIRSVRNVGYRFRENTTSS